MRPGDLVLVPVTFHQADGDKVRPVAVALDAGDRDFVAAPVTSRDRKSDFDLTVADWQSAGA